MQVICQLRRFGASAVNLEGRGYVKTPLGWLVVYGSDELALVDSVLCLMRGKLAVPINVDSSGTLLLGECKDLLHNHLSYAGTTTL